MIGLRTPKDDLMQRGDIDSDPELLHLPHPLMCTQSSLLHRPSSLCTGAHDEQESAEYGDGQEGYDGQYD